MTVAEILRLLHAEGAALSLDGEDLRLDWTGAAPSPATLAAIKAAKPEIVARLEMERRRIDRWVDDHLIDWPQEHCLGCRKRVIAGEEWIDVTNGTARARFHKECQAKWRAEQEALARRTIGFA